MKRALLRGLPRGATRPLLVLVLLSLSVGYAAQRGLLDPMSVLITVGGSFAVAWVTFPQQRIVAAWRHVVDVLREPPVDEEGSVEATIAELKRLARVYRVEGGPALDRAARRRRRIPGCARSPCARTDHAPRALLLPAVGAGDLAAAGPALGISILTTLYGAVLSNVVVLPIATKLSSSLARRWLVLQMVVLGAELIHRREYPTRVERALRSFAGLAPLAVRGDVTVLSDRAA